MTALATLLKTLNTYAKFTYFFNASVLKSNKH